MAPHIQESQSSQTQELEPAASCFLTLSCRFIFNPVAPQPEQRQPALWGGCCPLAFGTALGQEPCFARLHCSDGCQYSPGLRAHQVAGQVRNKGTRNVAAKTFPEHHSSEQQGRKSNREGEGRSSRFSYYSARRMWTAGGKQAGSLWTQLNPNTQGLLTGSHSLSQGATLREAADKHTHAHTYICVCTHIHK